MKTGPKPAANPDNAEQAAKILEEQLRQVKELTREFKEMYEGELLDDKLTQDGRNPFLTALPFFRGAAENVFIPININLFF